MDPIAPTVDDYRDALRRLRILIVGGGAIGQVFGHHLSVGGAEVSYFLKPRHAAEAAEGFDLHRYGIAGLRGKKHLQAEVFTDARMLRVQRFDQVWICTSSTALREGTFVEDIAAACPDVLWVSFQPGIEDHEYLTARVSKRRVVHGMVNFIAYQAPLPGEELWPVGIAYWVPPFSMTPFSGPEPYTSAVVNLLQSGGLTAGVRPDAIKSSRFGSAVLVPFVIALECAGWSFSELRKNGALMDLMITSIEDLHAALEKATGSPVGSYGLAQKPFFWKMALRMAPILASFPIETYFKFHFSKVRAQSDQMVDDLGQLCRDNALIPRALEMLRDEWRARRPLLDVDPDYRDPATGRLERSDTPPHGVASAVRKPEARPDTRPASPLPVNVAGTPEQVSPPRASTSVEIDVPKLPAPLVEPIEVDFEDEDDVLHSLELAAPSRSVIVDLDAAPAEEEDLPEIELEMVGLEEPTDDADIAVVKSDIPVDPADKPGAPVLRTLADLNRSKEEPPVESADEPPRPMPGSGLPFAVAEDAAAPSELTPQPTESQREGMRTVRDPEPREVHFGAAVPAEKRGEMLREDFIQTEFATEDQNASLRSLKERLRSRMGGSKSMSPALDNEDDLH